MRYYTPLEISNINGKSLATNGERYYCTNGKIYQGLYSKRLKIYTDPSIKGTAVVYEVTNQEEYTVSENLDYLNGLVDITNGNKVFTYDINKNLIKIEVYSDNLLLYLLTTKDLTYDINGNLTTLVQTTDTTITTSTFTYNIDGDLINKTIT